MLFNSFSYVVFLPVVFALYWICVPGKRYIVLMLASFVFYAIWDVRFFGLFFAEILLSFVCGKRIGIAKNKRTKKIWLCSGVTISILVLFTFKYLNFLLDSIHSLLNVKTGFEPFNIILPIGISFYTFQCMAYIIDVNRGVINAEENFCQYAAFISFFPQLVAGPIERADHLLPQIKKERKFDYKTATYGLKLMAWGYFKKIAIADTLALTVDKVWETPDAYTGLPLLIAVIFFGIQIYCDFSGYSDIARGTAKLFGIELTQNFKSPYFSSSIREFWSRWHITLSSWLRDYVYIPLGGNRKGKLRCIGNLFVTFCLSGMWHGANWTFLAWGGVHGAAVIVDRLISKQKKDNNLVLKVGGILFTNIIVFLAWIFFRSRSLTESISIIGNLFKSSQDMTETVLHQFLYPGRMIWLDIVILGVFDWFSLKQDVIEIIGNWKIRWMIYIILILFTYYQIPQTQEQAFLYFQF